MKNLFNQENLINRLFFAILVYMTGILGVHKFVKGKKGMGFAYLFTGGLFALGWIYDTVLAIINIFKPLNYFNYYEKYEIVNIDSYNVANNINMKHDVKYTEPETINSMILNDFSEATIYNEIRIVQESTYLIDTSKNINTVISRIQFVPEHISYLKKLEANGLYKASPTANEYYNDYVLLKDKKIQQAIVRSYKDVLDKTNELKTEKGRQNRINKYFDTLIKYKPMLSPTMNAYIDNFIEIRK